MIFESRNFSFLQEHDPIFLQLATSAERAFRPDPNTTLIKLRQLGEAIAQDLAARMGIENAGSLGQADLLFILNREIGLEPEIRSLFHSLRIEGNKATHQFRTLHRDALDGLQVARSLAIWYHKSFGKAGPGFKAGAFVAPTDPSEQLRDLQAEIALARAQAAEKDQLAKLLQLEKDEASALASKMHEEAKIFEQLALEQEQRTHDQQKEFAERLLKVQVTEPQKVTERTRKAFQSFELNEELTRILIDKQLNETGWLADTQEHTYAKGARPEKGVNQAIAEWPTIGRESADYVLFHGLTPIAVVEAKRANVDVAGKITQAERYSRGFVVLPELQMAWAKEGRNAPWSDSNQGIYQIPFAYSCNGKPYQKQLAEKSGTWFRDLRKPSNLARPLQVFHSPAGLSDLLQRNREQAEQLLIHEGFSYLRLRDYQERAIQSVERALAADQRECLVAMATGTGKTRTILGLMYRLLKSERFHRILFLVDRSALGTQAIESFADAPLEQNQPLSKIYNIAELGDMATEAETRVQVATVQAMVKRIFQSDTPPSIDSFDCIIVDEAHRGYTLDQEMTDAELLYRDASQYLSTYRRVLDHFDAVKIAMTATPAKHTTEIFGKPVYVYSYREAVADGWLIDYEPPIRYETLLTQNGIKFEKGETVHVINTKANKVDTAELDDELKFDVESFNRRVITEPFNRVICEQLADELDPFGDEKTMVFCATDLHADMVTRLLGDAFKARYGETYNEAAVKKITGETDKVQAWIKRYKNERYPNIAITVDLLTTGIDVPKICHLVFLRRVRSRILYEQMKGRATRCCPEIGKTVFKIYDPVDLYAALEKVDTMKPLVKNPNITLAQLLDELKQEKEAEHASDILAEISQKVMRVLRKAENKSHTQPALKEKLNELEQSWGINPAQVHTHLYKMGPGPAIDFFQKHKLFTQQLEEVQDILGSFLHPVISEHPDKFMVREQVMEEHGGVEDYLQHFHDFVCNEINQNVALSVVVNRPKDLTREQLKEVRLLLDNNGFSEAKLRAAWRNRTNEEIAASIVGYIRQAALGEALLPFDLRVKRGLQKILVMHNWTAVQRKWLERIAMQLTHEVVLDQSFINDAFAIDGGAKTLDRVLGNQLSPVLMNLAESIWTAA